MSIAETYIAVLSVESVTLCMRPKTVTGLSRVFVGERVTTFLLKRRGEGYCLQVLHLALLATQSISELAPSPNSPLTPPYCFIAALSQS